MTPADARCLLVRAALFVAAAAVLALAVFAYPGEIDWSVPWTWRARLLDGFLLTLVLSVAALGVALVVGTAGGLALVAREAVGLYVQLVRGTPFLVQIFVWCYCLAPLLGVQNVGGVWSRALFGVLALGVFGGAYVSEIVRGGIESVDRGQWEAARSLGLSHAETLRHVVLPQAVRTMLPPLTGEAVSLVKESSLLSVISVAEVTYYARRMGSSAYEGFAQYLPLAALYLCLTLPLTLLTLRLERRLAGPARLPVAEL